MIGIIKKTDWTSEKDRYILKDGRTEKDLYNLKSFLDFPSTYKINVCRGLYGKHSFREIITGTSNFEQHLWCNG
jgi:hypothetical protein